MTKDKLLNYEGAQLLYNDLRDRVEKAVPKGGRKGQVLKKRSAKDRDVGWVDDSGGITDFKVVANNMPTTSIVENGVVNFPIDQATFLGLALAAGDTTQQQSGSDHYTDEALSAIYEMLGIKYLIADKEEYSNTAEFAHTKGECFLWGSELYKATADIAVGDTLIENTNCEYITLADNFVKNDDYASATNAGVVKVADYGVGMGKSGLANYLVTVPASEQYIKEASDSNYCTYRIISPRNQHLATFYGLAKIAGDATQAASSNAAGVYTDEAKAAIKQMLGIQDGSTGTVNISGTAPTIAAVENTRYVCGEVTSLNFTPPASGISIVRFTSGSSVTVLTIPSTVKFPEWFDPTALETNTIYEICVTDGEFGAVMSWAL